MSGDQSGLSDEELMVAVKDGDLDAFERLTDRYKNRMAGFCWHYLHDYDEVRDLLQEIFLHVYRQAPRYEPTGRFASWLFAIAHGLCANAAKRKRRRVGVVATESDLPPREAGTSCLDQAVDGTAGVADRLVAAEEFARVRAAMDALPAESRQLLVFRMFEKLSYDEIGAILNIPAGVLRVRMHRALELLRARYFRGAQDIFR